MPVTNREMTSAQRGRFNSLAQRIFNRALHTLGRDAEELSEGSLTTSTFEDEEVMRTATFKLGEVVYTIQIHAHREEATT